MTKLHSKILWVGYFISFIFNNHGIINWIYIFFLSQSGIHIPIRIFEPFLKQGFGIRAKSIVAKEVGICNILFWYGPISKTDARNPRWDWQKNHIFTIIIIFQFFLLIHFSSFSSSQNLVFFLFHGIERLAESLRTIPTSPAVQSAVFLCFRVILIRMSPQHVTSLWPLIITEMVQIFSYLEQELSTDSEEWR